MILPFSLLVLDFKLVDLFYSVLIYSCFKIKIIINKKVAYLGTIGPFRHLSLMILVWTDPVLVDNF